MRDRFIVSILLATVVVAVALLPAPITGQARGAQPQAYTAPKNAIGQPDLSGIWQISDSSLASSVEAHTATYKSPAGQGAIVDPPGGMIPYLPGAMAKRQENFRNREKLDPLEKCYKPGVPRITFLNLPFQIVQSPDFVTIVYEYIHNSRTIYFNRKAHHEGLDFWNGDSLGRWEGNTLVVDVGHFNDQTWFDASGNYHSEALKVEERYTRTEPDFLTYEVTITDPKVFSRPWKMSALLYRHKEKNFKILEYECHAYLEDVVNQRGR
jgi:hypothetical protein